MRRPLIAFVLLSSVLLCRVDAGKPASYHTVSAVEKRFLDLLSTLPYTTSSEEVRKLVPELGPLREYAGDDNTEAKAEIRLFGLPALVSFSFHEGVLVSCGASIENLNRSHAVGIYTASRNYLRGRFGKGKEDEGYAQDDAYPDYSRNCSWTVNGIDFGASWKHHGKYQASWGAQAASKTRKGSGS